MRIAGADGFPPAPALDLWFKAPRLGGEPVHSLYYFAALSPASTFSGRAGSLVMRTPQAL